MRRLVIGLALLFCLSGVLPVLAALPPLEILIDRGSPYFLPSRAVVATGTAIQWDNPTPTHHPVTANGCVTDEPCAFDSGIVPPNGSYTIPSLPPGQYAYHCRLHPIMRGILTVVAPARAPART